MKKIYILIFGIMLLAAAIMLSGCAAQNQSQTQNPQYHQFNRGNFSQNPNGSGSFGNITDAQRQQMMQQRMQQSTDACQGKAEGDSCMMQNARSNMTGTCKNQNSTVQNNTLMCSVQFNRQRMQYQQPQGALPQDNQPTQ